MLRSLNSRTLGARAIASLLTASLLASGVVIGTGTTATFAAENTETTQATPSDNTGETATSVNIEAEPGSFSSRLNKAFSLVKASGFQPGESVTATLDGQPVEWLSGRHDTNPTLIADEHGVVYEFIVADPSLAATGVPHTLTITSPSASGSIELQFSPNVKLINAGDEDKRDTSISALVNAHVWGLPQGAVVDYVGTETQNFLSAGTQGVADETSKVMIPNVQIPSDEALLNAPIYIHYTINGKTTNYDSGLSITPSNVPFGGNEYTVDSTELEQGLYQVRYNKKLNTLFVTRTDRSSKRTGSSIFKIDPDTLQVTASVDPKSVGGSKVYGLGLDETRDRVWVTNSTSDSVAVYNAGDLSLIRQFDEGVVEHGRDVIIDETTGKAYVAAPRDDAESITVLDADTGSVEKLPTPGFSEAISLRLNQDTGDLYAVSMGSPKVAKINVRTKDVQVYALPEDITNRSSGIEIDPSTGHIFVANQRTNNVVVYDPNTEKVVADIPTGARTLGIVYNPVTKMMYVVNRESGTLNVIDPASNKKVATIDAGVYPNDLTVDAAGRIFVTTKGTRAGTDTNTLFRYTPKPVEVTQPSPNPQPQPPVDVDEPVKPQGSTSGSSTAVLGTAAVLGVLGAIIAACAQLIRTGAFPAQLLPQQIRTLLHL